MKRPTACSPTESIKTFRISTMVQMPSHSHSDWEVVSIRGESGVHHVGSSRHRFTDGDFVIVPPGVPHVWTFDSADLPPGAVRRVLLVNDKWLQEGIRQTGHSALGSLFALRTPLPLTGGIRKTLDRLIDEADQSDSPLAALRVFEVFLRAANKISREPAGAPTGDNDWNPAESPRLTRFRHYVLMNFTRPIRLADAASHLGMSRSAFCLFIRRELGESMTRYVNRVRIREICMRLGCSQLSIAQAVESSGFNDLAYFCRVFKSIMGLSPGEWRSQQRMESKRDPSKNSAFTISTSARSRKACSFSNSPAPAPTPICSEIGKSLR